MTDPTDEMREYILMIRFAERGGDRVVDEYGQRIHNEYMERWGGRGFDDGRRAFTLALLKLRGDSSWMLHYTGPEEAAEWLEDSIRRAAEEMDQKVELSTSEVVQDMTKRF